MDEKQLRELIPEARTASGRALWSPKTAVVKPIEVVNRLRKELTNRGVKIVQKAKIFKAQPSERIVNLSNGMNKILSFIQLHRTTSGSCHKAIRGRRPILTVTILRTLLATKGGLPNPTTNKPISGTRSKCSIPRCTFQPKCR